LLIEKSTAKTELEIGSENCIAADSEINNQTISLPIQKPAIKKLYRCRFKNRKPNYVVAE